MPFDIPLFVSCTADQKSRRESKFKEDRRLLHVPLESRYCSGKNQESTRTSERSVIDYIKCTSSISVSAVYRWSLTQ
jgi:hypothetical protein